MKKQTKNFSSAWWIARRGGGEPGNLLGLANLTTKPFQQFQGCWTVYGDKQRCIAVDVGLRQAMQKPEERLLNVRLFFPLWNGWK